MKKMTLALIVLFAGCLSANAQFTLERTGLVITEKPEADYIVLDFEGKTQQELYQAVNVYLHSLYVNPQNVLSTVENQAITINGVSPKVIYFDKNMKGQALMGNVYYTISLAFKDGRIRVNIPSILRLYREYGDEEIFIEGAKIMGYVNGVFDRKGNLHRSDTKKSIENYFNGYVAKLEAAVNGGGSNDW